MGGGSAARKSSEDDLSPSSLRIISDGLPSSNGFDPLGNGELEKVGDSNTAEEYSDSMRLRRHCRIYREILRSENDSSETRVAKVEEMKEEILRYEPGSLIELVGGFERSDYDIPRTTTILLVGSRGSGKSSLVNKISRFFECDDFVPDRAQVSYNLSGDGTHFLQEYMIPRGRTSFSMFDTRSFSEDYSENLELLQSWMLEGVQHGRVVMRKSDSPTAKSIMRNKARGVLCCSSEKKMVNFVVFVVNGVSVLKSIVDGDSTQYTSMLSKIFNCPCLSFKDDKPIVVVSHGDELALSDRVQVRIHLGELLGISPVTQIFDIPDNQDLSTKIAIVKMLHHCLEHADRNLPFKKEKVRIKDLALRIMMILVLFISFVVLIVFRRWFAQQRSEIHIDWHRIKHLW